jgi:hypothetical protein
MASTLSSVASLKVYFSLFMHGLENSGLDIVKKIEGFGSGSGKTSKKIVVADCGQL